MSCKLIASKIRISVVTIAESDQIQIKDLGTENNALQGSACILPSFLTLHERFDAARVASGVRGLRYTSVRLHCSSCILVCAAKSTIEGSSGLD